MSNDRRRRQKSRRRRGQGSYQPTGPIKFPGFMGWMQRAQRGFYIGGIVVMVLSLGAIIFATQVGGGGNASPMTGTTDTANTTQNVTASPTPEATVQAEDKATGQPDEDGIVRTYREEPELTIDTSSHYEAVIHTEGGEIRIELLPGEAPGYVNNFVFLARNHFYEGLTFHRVVPGFVAQAGDPTATGYGGAGYRLTEERNELPFESGVLSMAKAGSSVDGAQFFITLAPAPNLTGTFTVFGHVTAGMDVLQALTPRDPEQASMPGDLILRIEIIES